MVTKKDAKKESDELIATKKAVEDLFSDEPLSSQPEEIAAALYSKFTPEQKHRFAVIVETLRAEYPEGIDMLQLTMAAAVTVLQFQALGHFTNVINQDSIRDMSESEVEALSYAKSLYEESVNKVLKSAESDYQGTSFLKELDEFKMSLSKDGTLHIEGKKQPKLKMESIKFIDTKAAKKGDN